MPLTLGARLGHYTIERSLGAGGMGEVYRARDTRLIRDVAIKSLPDIFADDPERITRFEREARVLAALNHPNIAGIHGLEQLGETRFLILEFIDGQSLAERLTTGRLPLDEAVAIARQMLDALEAAHEKGIIHRDIKPANVMLTAEGQVKVLDFGLARVVDSDPARSASTSPTLTFAATQMGVILGTAAYMAPEQAKGRAADKRCDVWAFGCVFYEMLTGKRVFDGEDVSDTLAAVLRAEPDLRLLPDDVPPGIRSLLKRCLERDRKARIPDISAVRFLLDDAITAPPPAVKATSATMARPVWKRIIPAAVTGVATTVTAGAVVWMVKPAPPAEVTRFDLTLSAETPFSNTARRVVTVSRDGRRMAYVARSQLFLRNMSDGEARPIRGSEVRGGLTDPAFSPDGESIAFWAFNDRSLKRIPVVGGSAITICPAEPTFGMTWEPGTLIFGQGSKGIMQVSDQGGTPSLIVPVKDDELAHGPQLLPGGDRVLFTLASGESLDRWDQASAVVQSLKSGQRTTVQRNASDARYVPTGHLIYAVRGVLFAAPFDPRRLTVESPVSLLEGVKRSSANATGTAQYAVSGTGTLVYVPGPVAAESGNFDLGLADRNGNVQLLKLQPGSYQAPRISPDGNQVAFGTDDGKEAIIYVHDLSGGTSMRRLTRDGNNRYPAWTHDGRRIAFQSDRRGAPAVFWQLADGTGPADALTTPADGEAHAPESWSPNGDRLLFSVRKGSSVSLWEYSVSDRKAFPFAAQFGGVQSSFPTGAVFSPDGGWVAYVVSERNRPKIFVRPYPPTEAKYELPMAQAPHEVTWSNDGTELFFNPLLLQFASVSVTTKPAFTFGKYVPIRKEFMLGPPSAWRNYDVSRDGRFLGVFAPSQDGTVAATREIRVVLNWFEELKQRVPAR